MPSQHKRHPRQLRQKVRRSTQLPCRPRDTGPGTELLHAGRAVSGNTLTVRPLHLRPLRPATYAFTNLRPQPVLIFKPNPTTIMTPVTYIMTPSASSCAPQARVHNNQPRHIRQALSKCNASTCAPTAHQRQQTSPASPAKPRRANRARTVHAPTRLQHSVRPRAALLPHPPAPPHSTLPGTSPAAELAPCRASLLLALGRLLAAVSWRLRVQPRAPSTADPWQGESGSNCGAC